MTNSQRLAIVRAHLRRWLSEHVGPGCHAHPAAGDPPEPVDAAAEAGGDAESQGSTGGVSPGEASTEAHSGDAPPETAVGDREPTAGRPAATEGSDTGQSGDTGEPAEPRITRESILIRDGYYNGRTFSASAGGQTLRAVWFMEPDELKIHGSDGQLLAVFRGDEIVGGADTESVAEETQPRILPLPAAREAAPSQPAEAPAAEAAQTETPAADAPATEAAAPEVAASAKTETELAEEDRQESAQEPTRRAA